MRIPALLAAAVLAACSSSDHNEAPTHLPATGPAPNTSSLAFSTAGDRYKLYLETAQNPDGRLFLAVVDAAAPHASNAALRYVDLGVGSDPIAVAAAGNDAVAVDAVVPRAYFIDAAHDTLRATADLPASSVPYRVSDNQVLSTGAAMDAARRRAWIATSDGVVELDLDAHAITTVFATPPPENFAYDSTRRTLLLPYYLCDPAVVGPCTSYAQPGGPDLTDGATVVDLAFGRTFATVDPGAVDTHMPLGFRPDGVAVDPALGVAALTLEDGTLRVIEHGAATFDLATGTAQLPTRLTVTLPGTEFTPVTVDPVTHLAIVAEEGGPGIVFVDLALAKAGTAHVLSFVMPDMPDAFSWTSRRDPHGVTVGVVGGKPYAFLVSVERTWVARIDLAKVATLAPLDLAGFASAVSYLLVPVPP